MIAARLLRLRCDSAASFRPRLEHLEDRTTPATFNVTTTLDVIDPADGKRSLREAITAANSLAGADVIVVPAGVFKLALNGADENANATGDFDITDAVTITGAGAGLTLIDGQQLDRVMDVLGTAPSSFKVVLAGLTVRNGSANNAGGIHVGNADLVVRDCAVVGNRAVSGNGGGISNAFASSTGTLKLVRTTVARNIAVGTGGGIDFFGGDSAFTLTSSMVRRNVCGSVGGGIDAITVTLTNCTVSGNLTTGGNGGGIGAGTATLTNCTVSGNASGGLGGGISATTQVLTDCTVSGNSAIAGGGINATTATFTNCTVSGNLASGGGGGGIASPTATLTRSTVSGNTASTDGGGIIATSTVTLTNSTVSGNTALTSGGGGIEASTANLTNTTVSGNTTDTDGGGVRALNATLLNCTVADNIAHRGGGIRANVGGTFNIRNTIVALNLTDLMGSNPDVSGTFASQGHNLIGDGTGTTGFTNGTNGDIVGTSTNPIDPKLGPLANNGGPTKTMALLAGSLAIDHGDNSILPSTDQRGFPRKKDGNGDGSAIVDIGAFEK
jgi:predicted outer membrane repeat protein